MYKYLRIVVSLSVLFVPCAGRGQTRIVRPGAADLGWITEPWLKQSVAFDRAEKAVDQDKEKSRSKVTAWLSQYRKMWLEKPTDRILLFKYACAIFLASKDHMKVDYNRREVLAHFVDFPSPQAYPYSRIRFLLESQEFPRAQLKTMGQRLLKENPNDGDVVYTYIDYLDMRKNAEKQQALRLANKLEKLKPGNSSVEATFGWIYFRLWLTSNDKMDADRSVKYYQSFLKKSDISHPFRPQATRIIALLRKRAGLH